MRGRAHARNVTFRYCKPSQIRAFLYCMEKYSNFRGFKLIEVFEVHVNEGNGSTDDPIYREVFYVTKEGKIIGHESSFPIRKFAGE